MSDQCGAVVQLVRIPACHAGGRGFESRPLRHLFRKTLAEMLGFFVSTGLIWSATNESRLPATPAVSHLFRNPVFGLGFVVLEQSDSPSQGTSPARVRVQLNATRARCPPLPRHFFKQSAKLRVPVEKLGLFRMRKVSLPSLLCI